LVAIGFWQGWGPFSGRDSGPPAARRLTKDWILVAEFDGPPGDSTLAVAVRDLLSAALDQSEIVATVPREQIRLALRSAGRPASARVDAELARELAYRSSVRAVLEGTVGRLGQGYSVVLRVVDADSLKTVLTESAVAKSEDALIPTLGRLAEKLRAGLGERRAAIAASRPLNLAATPSFEANRLRVRAVGMIGEGRARGAIPLLHDALALDPDFALAWSTLGSAFGNAGQPDSALAAYDQALRRPERMTTIQRLSTEGTRALSVGDPSAALAAFDRALQYDPAYTGGAGMRAFTLWALGRLDEALAGFRRERRGNPFGATLVTRSNELLVLIALGRLYEARDSLRSFPGRQTPVPLALVEIAACNWAAAESLAALGLADPDLDDSRRAEVSACLATARAARGALRSADSTFEHVEEMALHAADLYWEDAARRARLMLSVASAGAVALPADKWVRDSSTAEIVTRGLQAAIGGNRIEAQRLLSRARSRPRNALAQHGASPALLEAQIEALGGRWGEVARILRSIASQRIETGVLHYPAGMSPIRWLLADAFEHLGRPDSAAIVLERVTRDPAPVPDESHLRGIFLPFAHRRLVLLYARMGRIEDAKLHWQIFSEAMRTPDPEIQPLIAEARAALAGAEGIAKSSAR
jgi:tetratricopeptide (TPR) repeat protein